MHDDKRETINQKPDITLGDKNTPKISSQRTRVRLQLKFLGSTPSNGTSNHRPSLHPALCALREGECYELSVACPEDWTREQEMHSHSDAMRRDTIRAATLHAHAVYVYPTPGCPRPPTQVLAHKQVQSFPPFIHGARRLAMAIRRRQRAALVRQSADDGGDTHRNNGSSRDASQPIRGTSNKRKRTFSTSTAVGSCRVTCQGPLSRWWSTAYPPPNPHAQPGTTVLLTFHVPHTAAIKLVCLCSTENQPPVDSSNGHPFKPQWVQTSLTQVSMDELLRGSDVSTTGQAQRQTTKDNTCATYLPPYNTTYTNTGTTNQSVKQSTTEDAFSKSRHRVRVRDLVVCQPPYETLCSFDAVVLRIEWQRVPGGAGGAGIDGGEGSGVLEANMTARDVHSADNMTVYLKCHRTGSAPPFLFLGARVRFTRFASARNSLHLIWVRGFTHIGDLKLCSQIGFHL